jgi:hypothetical protein
MFNPFKMKKLVSFKKFNEGIEDQESESFIDPSYTVADFTEDEVEYINDLFTEYIDKYHLLEYPKHNGNIIDLNLCSDNIYYEVGLLSYTNTNICIDVRSYPRIHLTEDKYKRIITELRDDMENKFIPRMEKIGFELIKNSFNTWAGEIELSIVFTKKS